MADEIVTEIRRIREEFSARFNHDLDAMFRYLKERERESGEHYVSLTKRRKKRWASPPRAELRRKANR
jgi:hypothetical protein